MATQNDIKVTLSLRDAEFRSGLNRAKSGMKEFATAVSSVAGGLGVLLPAASIAAMVSFAKSSIDAADKLNDLRQITGLSVPTLNGLSFAAKQSGTDLGALAKGVGQFAKFVDAAKNPTSDQARLMAELGISAKTPEAALLQIADIFKSMPDGLEKTNLAMELFGKAGASMIPLLNGGSAALREMMETGQALNPVTQEMAAAADALNDNLDKLKASAQGMGTNLAKEILPGLQQVTAAMAEAAKEGDVLKTLWVGLGGLGAALFTDDLLTNTQKLAKEQAFLNKMVDAGWEADNKSVLAQREKVAILEKAIAVEQKAAAAADQTAKATEKRNEVQQQQSATLIKIKEYETTQVKAALDDQAKAYRVANAAIEKTEKDRIALAEKNKQRLIDLLAPDAKPLDLKAEDPTERTFNQATGRSNLNELLAKAQNALAAKDFETAIATGEKAIALIAELKDAGAQSTSVLAAQLRDIASIQDQALAGRGEGEKAKAAEAKATLDSIQKELSALKLIPIGIDLAKAEAAMVEANKRMQAILDANPLTQPVKVAAAGGPPVPGYASGGLIRGPGGPRSDSVLARLSAGEFVLQADAVKHYGLGLLSRLNARSLPAFAAGGLVGGSASQVLNLTLPGVGSFETKASAAVAAELQRALRMSALQHGRRT